MSDSIERYVDQPSFSSGKVWSSIKADTQEERLTVYAAISDSESLEEYVDSVIMVRDVVVQPVEVENNKTGEMLEATRIVLVSETGEAYGCTSLGVETSVKNLFCIVGYPPWHPSIPLVPVKKNGKKGYKFTSLRLATEQDKTNA